MAPGENWNRRENQLEKMREHQVQTVEKRRELLERLQFQQAKPKSSEAQKDPVGRDKQDPPVINVSTVTTAVQLVSLMPLEVGLGEPAVVNRPTLALLQQFFEALSSGVSASVLQWPSGPRDVSVLHPLAMVALLRAPERRITGNYAWCEPALSCRTLYFPWRGGANLSGQRYLLRRTDLTDWNKYHLARRFAAPDTPALLTDKLHETIGHLHRLQVRDTTKRHLAHPALNELYPIFAAMGDDPAFAAAQNELFGRVRFGAALDKMTDHRPALAAPEDAPYGLYGVAHDADLRRALGARCITGPGRAPQICIIDLNAPGLKRLGYDWPERLEQFIGETIKRFPNIPFLAVTHDPFVHRRTESILRGRLRPKRPVSKIIVRKTQDVLTVDPLAESLSPVKARFSSTAVSVVRTFGADGCLI